jgi:hypothetical protein
VSKRRLPCAGLALVIALAVFAVVGCGDDERREVKPRERAKVRQFAIMDRRPQGGTLDAQTKKGDLLDLRIFVSGPGGPGGVVHVPGYGLAAPVKRQPPDTGYYARLRFRTSRVGRFEVVMEQPHVKVGYLTVTLTAPPGG